MTRVDFGYKKVAPEEKTQLVRGVFESVADRYDLMNDLMSLGTHRSSISLAAPATWRLCSLRWWATAGWWFWRTSMRR